MVGSIASSAPMFHAEGGFHFIDRGFCCPVCSTVQQWNERSTSDGLPLGVFFHARLLSGPEASEWLRAHPALTNDYNQP
jgi:hypothetical protein